MMRTIKELINGNHVQRRDNRVGGDGNDQKRLSRRGKKTTELQNYQNFAEIFVMLDASLKFLVYCSNVIFQK